MEDKYLNYAGQQIKYDDFIKKAAEGVDSFMNKYNWSSNTKSKFMEAYKDIIAHGITGMDYSTGEDELTLANDIGLDDMPKRQATRYHHAAYYLINTMKSLADNPSSNNKTPYDNTTHANKIREFIGNTYYKGMPNWLSEWNDLDARGENNLRGTTNRAKKLADALELYRDSLVENDYDFTNSPFKSFDNLKQSLTNAINSLRDTPDNISFDSNDRNALNELGLNWRQYLSDGGDDQIRYQGQVMTYNDLNGLLQQQNQDAEEKQSNQNVVKQEEASQKEEAPVKALYAWTNKTPRSFKDLSHRYTTINDMFDKLATVAISNFDDIEKAADLFGIMKYISDGGDTYKGNKEAITDEEFNVIKKYKPYNSADYSKENFFKVKKLSGNKDISVIWDSKNNKLLRIMDQKTYDALSQGILDNNWGDVKEPTLKEEFDPAVITDATSVLGDLISLSGAKANIVGTGISLSSDIISDIERGRPIGEVLKHAGQNVLYGAIGLFPNKKFDKIRRRIGPILTFASAAVTGADENVWKSANKLMNGEDLTSTDVENIKWLLKAVINVGSTAQRMSAQSKVSKALDKNTQTVKTTNGKEVKLTNQEVRKINREGDRKGNDAAKAKFKEIAKKKGVEDAEIDNSYFNFAKPGIVARVFGSKSNVPMRLNYKLENPIANNGMFSRNYPEYYSRYLASESETRKGSFWDAMQQMFKRNKAAETTNNSPKPTLPAKRTYETPKSKVGEVKPADVARNKMKPTELDKITASVNAQGLDRGALNLFNSAKNGNFTPMHVRTGKIKVNGVDYSITNDGSGNINISYNGKVQRIPSDNTGRVDNYGVKRAMMQLIPQTNLTPQDLRGLYSLGLFKKGGKV